MNDTVVSLLVVLAIGAGLGGYLGRRPRRAGRLALAVLAVPGLPLLLLLLAGVVGSPVLGWIAGLSLMVLAMVAVPLAAGVAAGWVVSRRQRLHLDARASAAAPARTDPGLPERAAAAAPVTGQAACPPAHAATSSAAAPQGAPASCGLTGPLQPLPPLHPSARLGLLLAMMWVAAGFWLVLALGFRVNGGGPSWLQRGLWPAASVVLALLIVGVRRLPWRSTMRQLLMSRRTVPAHAGQANLAQRRHWLAALEANPQTRPYAERIVAGDLFWNPERVAYDLERSATACCQHLAPLERALRSEGHPLYLVGAGEVRTDSGVDAEALAGHPLQPVEVVYEAWHQQDRQGDDEPVARLRCTTCGDRLWVRHPLGGGPSPVFTPEAVAVRR